MANPRSNHLRHAFHPRHRHSRTFAVLAAIAGLATAAWAFDETQADAPQGLAGILPRMSRKV